MLKTVMCAQAAYDTEEQLRVELQRLEEDCDALDAQLCTQAGSQCVPRGPARVGGGSALPAQVDMRWR